MSVGPNTPDMSNSPMGGAGGPPDSQGLPPGGGSPGGAGTVPPGGGPMSAPASAIGAKALMQAQGKVVVQILEKMLPIAGSGSEEGKSIMTALKAMSKSFTGEEADQKSAAMVQLIQRAMGKGGQGGPGAMPAPNRGPIPAPAG